MEEFVEKQLELLELEREAEIEETRNLYENVPSKDLEKAGLCIRKVKVASRKTGLYGRSLVKFEPQWSDKNLPSHNIGPGDIIGVCVASEFGHRDVIVSGVVWSSKGNSMTIAFDDTLDALPIEDQLVYSLVKVANYVTYKRLKNGMQDLKNYKDGPASHLIEVLFGLTSPSSALLSLDSKISSDGEIRFCNTSLDESQRKAVKFALLQKEIGIIHGPPGTGKTTVLVEIIRQSIAQGLKVLVCAQSNVAVDNLVEKLAKAEVKLVRLGHPARTIITNQKLSLDAQLTNCDNYKLIKDIRDEMDHLLTNTGKFKNKLSKHQMRNETKLLSRELKDREVSAIREVLKMADVVLATLVSAHSQGPLKHLPKEYFDLVVIDECSQALEVACWIPLLRAPKCILAGDHLQLPPTIVSKMAAKGGLDLTLMERILHLSSGSAVVQMLLTQYRMHEAIMQWSSNRFYEGKLLADQSVKQHLLRDLSYVEDNESTSIPLLLIDTAGCDLYEMDVDGETSKGNKGEACLVSIHVESLIKSGVRPCDIAVTAPYNLQVEMMRTLLSSKYPGIEIKSVDGFQGREKEAVILSFTRSNLKREVGFLAEERRINVAITRARRHLAVICDSETVSHHAFLKELVEYLGSKGEVKSAQQYQKELDILLSNTTFTHPKGNAVSVSVKSKSSSKKKGNLNSEKPPSTNKSEENSNNGPFNQEKFGNKYKTILEDFIANDNQHSYKFPASLTSFERLLIHELAEDLKLIHISQGEGNERCIVISKKTKTPSLKKTQQTKASFEPVKKVTEEHNKPSFAQGNIAKPKDSVNEDSENLGNDYDDNYNKDSCVENVKEESTSSLKTVSKKKRSVRQKSAEVTLASSDDDPELDSFIVELTKKDNTCSFPKCKVSIAIIKQECNFCRKAYCLGHNIPEVHGCGREAHIQARRQMYKEGIGGPTSGIKFNKSKTRAQLEKLLDKKLNELSSKRSRKAQSDK